MKTLLACVLFSAFTLNVAACDLDVSSKNLDLQTMTGQDPELQLETKTANPVPEKAWANTNYE